MTLVDVLAGLCILAATIVVLAPLAVEARASAARSGDAVQLRAALSAVVPPDEPSGERTATGLPDGCRLRWHSTPLPVAPGSGPATARLLTLQVVRGLGSAERVLAERSVPVLGAAP